jgi:hypothetical protein
MNKTTDNFWAAFQAWQAEPETVHVTLYRLYYDDRGYLICYSGDDMPGNYIDVDPEIFRRALTNVRVVENKLVIIETQSVFNKLVPNTVEGTACDPHNVSIIVDADQNHTKWKLKTNEPN